MADGAELGLVRIQYAMLIGILPGQLVVDVRGADQFCFGNLCLVLVICQIHPEAG